jgi:hypothetical protein
VADPDVGPPAIQFSAALNVGHPSDDGNMFLTKNGNNYIFGWLQTGLNSPHQNLALEGEANHEIQKPDVCRSGVILGVGEFSSSAYG